MRLHQLLFGLTEIIKHQGSEEGRLHLKSSPAGPLNPGASSLHHQQAELSALTA